MLKPSPGLDPRFRERVGASSFSLTRCRLCRALPFFGVASERIQPAKKLITDRKNYSEEEAAEFSGGCPRLGGERGLFLFRLDCGIHYLAPDAVLCHTF